MKKKLIRFFKKRTPFFFVLLTLCLVSFGTEIALVYIPQGESATERQTKIFQKYWEEEGAAKFKAVGLEPTEKLYNEELEAHLKKALATEAETNPELRVKQLKKEFQAWWDNEGKDTYFAEGIVPDEALYKREEKKFIQGYKDSKLIYSIRLEIQDPSSMQMLTHWILFPNLFLFLLTAAGLLYASDKMTRRFGAPIAGALFAASIFLGALLISALGQTSFFTHAEEPFSGMFLAASLCLGTVCIGRNRDCVEKLQTVVAATIYIAMTTVAIITCTQTYIAAIVVSVPMIFGGTALGKFLPERKKSKKEIEKEKREALAAKPKEDPVTVRKKQTRTLLMEGFECAMQGDNNLAKEKLGQGMHELLLESPADKELILDMAKKLTNPSLYIAVSSSEWQEWGMASFQKKVPEAALYFLDRSLIDERDKNSARKTLLYIGGIRLRMNLKPEEGVKRLEKVIELKDDDLFAEQAKKLLEKLAPKKEPEKPREEIKAEAEPEVGENGMLLKPRKLSSYVEEDETVQKPQPVKNVEEKQPAAKPKTASPFSKPSPFSSLRSSNDKFPESGEH